MNERIEDMSSEAWRYANNTVSELPQLKRFEQKFAELIVRDCLARVEGCTIITTQQVQPVSEFNQGYDKAIEKVYSQVKLHFGVK